MKFIITYKNSEDFKKAEGAWKILDALQIKILEDTAAGNVTRFEAFYGGNVEELWVNLSPRSPKANCIMFPNRRRTHRRQPTH